jgi:hypothetical protein
MTQDHPDFQPNLELNEDNINRPSVERAVEVLNSAWGLANFDEEPELDEEERSERIRSYLLAGCHDLVELAAGDPEYLTELMDATARLRPRAAQMAASMLAAECAMHGVRFGQAPTGGG